MARKPAVVHGGLAVDKPRGPTSHDVVALARKALRTRAVGHTGTLDPMATGVLLLVVGEATKLVPYLTAEDKAYEASIRLGVETDSLDAEGRVVGQAPVPSGLDRAQVEEAAQEQLGERRQRAPAISAIKVAGEPLYAKARRGAQVEAPEREVVLHEVEVAAVEGDRIDVRLTCGKGYYVRAFARDLAGRLGTVGHLTALRRVRLGPVSVEGCVDAETLRAAAQGDPEAAQRLRERLVAPATLCGGMPRVALDAEGVQAAFHGRPIDARHLAWEGDLPTGPVALLDAEGTLCAVARPEGGRLHVLRGFRYG